MGGVAEGTAAAEPAAGRSTRAAAPEGDKMCAEQSRAAPGEQGLLQDAAERRVLDVGRWGLGKTARATLGKNYRSRPSTSLNCSCNNSAEDQESCVELEDHQPCVVEEEETRRDYIPRPEELPVNRVAVGERSQEFVPALSGAAAAEYRGSEASEENPKFLATWCCSPTKSLSREC